MNIYVRAAVVTSSVALIFFVGFLLLRTRAGTAGQESRLSQLESFESRGVPGIAAVTIDGHPFKLSDLQGKVVLINFWASWCGPCLEEMPSLISLVESQNGSVQLVAISGDSNREDIDAFLKAFPKAKNPNIHLVWDEDRSISKSYMIDRLPESFVTNRDLKLVKKIIGSINWYTPDSVNFMKELVSK